MAPFAALRAKAEGAVSKAKSTVNAKRQSQSQSTVPTPPARGFGHLPQSSTSSIPEPASPPRQRNVNHGRRSQAENSEETSGAAVDALVHNKEQFFEFMDEFFSNRDHKPAVRDNATPDFTAITQTPQREIVKPAVLPKPRPLVAPKPAVAADRPVIPNASRPPLVPSHSRPNGALPPAPRPDPPERVPSNPPPLLARPTLSPTPSGVPHQPTVTFDLVPTAYPRSEPCAAQRLCTWFSPKTTWVANFQGTGRPWFVDDETTQCPLPPVLVGCLEARTTTGMSWSQARAGAPKDVTHFGMVLFQDSSIAWWRIKWNETNPLGTVQRETRYRPPPDPWDGERLYAAHELYGDIITEYCEQANIKQEYVSRGECWDMANEPIQHISKVSPNVPIPLPTVGRTHGHLIYEGGISPERGVWGRWRGGENAVRAGDVLEWYDAQVKSTSHATGQVQSMKIGAPEHTAVIVSSHAIDSVSDSVDLPLTSLPDFETIEQSVSTGMKPTKRTYHFSTMTMGKVWIYRVVGWDYIGVDKLAAEWPPSVECFEG